MPTSFYSLPKFLQFNSSLSLFCTPLSFSLALSFHPVLIFSRERKWSNKGMRCRWQERCKELAMSSESLRDSVFQPETEILNPHPLFVLFSPDQQAPTTLTYPLPQTSRKITSTVPEDGVSRMNSAPVQNGIFARSGWSLSVAKSSAIGPCCLCDECALMVDPLKLFWVITNSTYLGRFLVILYNKGANWRDY